MIKMVYFGMRAQMRGGLKQEYLILISPVRLDDVSTEIIKDQEIAPRIHPKMQIVVKDVPTWDNPSLTDNTEVDLIPTYVGG